MERPAKCHHAQNKSHEPDCESVPWPVEDQALEQNKHLTRQTSPPTALASDSEKSRSIALSALAKEPSYTALEKQGLAPNLGPPIEFYRT